MSLKTILAIAGLVMSGTMGFGQKTAYVTFNRALNEDGAGNIHLNEAEGPGIAWITGKELTEGVLEFDAKGKDAFQQSFVGIAFHGVNDTTYEAIYFRPFNFRSTDPVRKVHAVQYIANPHFDWPKLRADYPNKYEQPVSPAPDPNEWFHVKIAVAKEKISVFVNGNETPSFVVTPLVHTSGRRIGYWVGNGSSGDWKNLRVMP